jgi:hypothetical protein
VTLGRMRATYWPRRANTDAKYSNPAHPPATSTHPKKGHREQQADTSDKENAARDQDAARAGDGQCFQVLEQRMQTGTPGPFLSFQS